MADTKLSDLTAVAPAGADLVYLVDVSDTTDGPGGSSRKTTVAQIVALAAGGVSSVNGQTGVVTLTSTDVGADPSGTGAAAVAAHLAAANPHPQYAMASGLAAVATSGAYADLTGRPALAAVATSGAYTDLTGRPTLGTAAALDAPAAGNAAAGEAVKGSDTRLSDARTPTAHTHTASQISDATAAGRTLLTAADAAAQRTALGVPAGSGTSTGVNTGDQDLSGYATTAAVAAAYQPLDGDLTALAALTGTATIYYRSAANTWSAVTIGSGLNFAGGTLTATGGGGSSSAACLFTQTADTAVTNTIVESTLTGAGVGSLTLPAGFLTAGKTIRVKARGYISTQAGGANAGHKLKLGATPVWTVAGPFYNTSAVKWAWEGEWVITCRTTGVSGTVMVQGSVFRAGAVGGGAPQMMTVVNTGTATLDTTAGQTIDLTTTWATTGADNSVTCSNLTVEALN